MAFDPSTATPVDQGGPSSAFDPSTAQLVDSGPSPGIGARLLGVGDAAMAGANQFLVGGLGAAARTVNRLLPESLVGGADSKANAERDINAAQEAMTYRPQTQVGQQIGQAVSGLVQPIARTVGTVAGAVVGNENVPAAMDALATLGMKGPTEALSAVPLFKAAESFQQAREADGAVTPAGLAQRNKQLGLTSQDIIDNLSGGADTSPQGVGAVLQAQLKAAADRSRDASREGYERVAAMLPDGATVPVSRTQELLDRLTNVPGASATSETLVPGDIRKLATSLAKDAGEEGELPYDALRALRSNIGQQIDWSPFNSAGPSNGLYKAIYGAMGKDLDEGAASYGEDVAQAVRENSAAYAVASSTRKALGTVLNRAGGPEAVYKSLFNSTKDGATPLNAVLANVDLPTRQLLAASALERMGKATAGAQSAAGDVFSADNFLTNWNRMSDQAKSSLFGSLPGDYADSIQQLADNVGKLKAMGSVPAPRGLPSPLRALAAHPVIGSTVGTGVVEALAHAGLHGFGGVAAALPAGVAIGLALTNPATAKFLAMKSAEAVGRGAGYLGRVYASRGNGVAGTAETVPNADKAGFSPVGGPIR